jgi:hypothetical protein
MTNRQIEQEAERIRRNWTAPADEAPKTPLEAYIANTTAERPLGVGDVGILSALGYYGISPSSMSRDQKLERKALIQHLRHPDQTGLSTPNIEALNRNPDIMALWNGRTHEDPAVRDSVQNEIAERSNPRPTLDPRLTEACQRFAAKRFTPTRAPRS